MGLLVSRFISGRGRSLYGDQQGLFEKAFHGLVLFVSIREAHEWAYLVLFYFIRG
jgi:hypothetical protein